MDRSVKCPIPLSRTDAAPSDRQLLGMRRRPCWWSPPSHRGAVDQVHRPARPLRTGGRRPGQRRRRAAAEARTSSTTACSSAWSTASIPAANGKPNYVQIDLKPEYAESIPASVTATGGAEQRVRGVVGAVGRSADPARRSAPARSIPEDTELPTVLFQTTSASCATSSPRRAAAARTRSVGILAALDAATDNRRAALLTAGAQLNRAPRRTQSASSATEPAPPRSRRCIDATRGLQQTAPELLDALHQAVEPMQTLAETARAVGLADRRCACTPSARRARSRSNNHIDQLVKITGDFTPVLGHACGSRNNFVPAFVKLNNWPTSSWNEVWIRDTTSATCGRC